GTTRTTADESAAKRTRPVSHSASTPRARTSANSCSASARSCWAEPVDTCNWTVLSGMDEVSARVVDPLDGGEDAVGLVECGAGPTGVGHHGDERVNLRAVLRADLLLRQVDLVLLAGYPHGECGLGPVWTEPEGGL